MDERPLAVAAHPDRDRLHARAARGAAVAGALVEVHAPETMRAVIAVLRARRARAHLGAAVAAAEDVGLGGFVPARRRPLRILRVVPVGAGHGLLGQAAPGGAARNGSLARPRSARRER